MCMLFFDIIAKLSDILNKWDLLKSGIQSTYFIDFALFAAISMKKKMEIFDFVFKTAE